MWFLKRINVGVFCAVVIGLVSLSCTGCDLVLRIIQKDMVEEKKLFGDISKYNPKVEELQNMLKGVGYSPGPIDGKLGFKTRTAVKTFQKEQNLKITGYVGKQTWSILQESYKEETVAFEKIDVKKIQNALKNAGFDPGKIDGKMGSKTKKAIKDFQKSQGLPSDGVVGLRTWDKLKGWYIEENSP